MVSLYDGSGSGVAVVGSSAVDQDGQIVVRLDLNGDDVFDDAVGRYVSQVRLPGRSPARTRSGCA